MKKKVFLFVCIVLLSCQKEDFDIENLNNNSISVFGHGGMGDAHSYPMNTFESIQNCLSLGAFGTEMDVQMTRDSVLVAYHFEYLELATQLSGKISEKYWSEIKEGHYQGLPYEQLNLIKLDDLFANMPNLYNYTYSLDVKNYNKDTSAIYINTLTNAIIQLVEKYNLLNNVFVELKRRDLMISLISKNPEIKILASSSFDYAFQLANELDLFGIIISVDLISEEEVKVAHANGKRIAVYTNNQKKSNIDAIQKNVDYIQTDNLKYLLKLLK